MERGEVWWADLGLPRGSAPALRRPVVIVQNDRFSRSRLETVIVAAITSNLRLGRMPGNIVLKRGDSGLPADSVVNVTQVVTLDKQDLIERVGLLPGQVCREIDAGLQLVLDLKNPRA
ncbi:MAG: type II toxin-antitoxin system PemK/MazF family toxin [Acidimicrobiia bacterium]